MRIYTRTGDTGETGLYGGRRVAKDDVRVDAYGTVDEACAALGLAAAQLPPGALRDRTTGLQSLCFVLGADLATPMDAPSGARVARVGDETVADLESAIDALEADLTPLRSFILPGGSPAAASLHLARAILRRAERRVTTLLRVSPDTTNHATLRCLNRLGDLLFVLARAVNAAAGVDDIPWNPAEE